MKRVLRTGSRRECSCKNWMHAMAAFIYLPALWLSSCCSQQRIPETVIQPAAMYTVTVYLKNEIPFFNAGRLLFHFEWPYPVEQFDGNDLPPVLQLVYNHMSAEQYEALCRRLKDQPGVLSIQKIPE